MLTEFISDKSNYKLYINSYQLNVKNALHISVIYLKTVANAL